MKNKMKKRRGECNEMKIRKVATSQERRWWSRQCTTHYAFLTSLWEASRLIPHHSDRLLLNHASSIHTQLVLLLFLLFPHLLFLHLLHFLLLLLLLLLLFRGCVRLFQAEADVTYSFFFFLFMLFFSPSSAT